MARGDYETAARRLRGALRLWKGPAFDGVNPGPRLAELIADLEATRKSVVEQWVEAELGLGRHRELRSGLAELSRARSGAGDSGWGRVGPAVRSAGSAAPFPSSGTGSDFRPFEFAGTQETYRALADVLRADFGAGSGAGSDAGPDAGSAAATTSAVRRTLLRGTPLPSMA